MANRCSSTQRSRRLCNPWPIQVADGAESSQGLHGLRRLLLRCPGHLRLLRGSHGPAGAAGQGLLSFSARPGNGRNSRGLLKGEAGSQGKRVTWLGVKTNGIAFWLVGAKLVLVYSSGDWDVHWGYGILTQGHMFTLKENHTHFEGQE